HAGNVTALETLDHRQLPKRTPAIERAGQQVLREIDELSPTARRRKGAVTDVQIEVEGLVVGPDRKSQPSGNVDDLLPESRREREPGLDRPPDVLEPCPSRRSCRRIEHGERRDM